MNDGQRSAVCAPAKCTRPSGARSADQAAWTWPGRRTPRCRGVRIAGPVVGVDADDLGLGRELAQRGGHRRRGRPRRGRRGRRTEADEQRRRRPWSPSRRGVQPRAAAQRDRVVRDAAREHPRLDALPGVVLGRRPRLRGRERRRERDRRQHADRHRDDDRARPQRLALRGGHGHAAAASCAIAATGAPSAAPPRGRRRRSPRTAPRCRPGSASRARRPRDGARRERSAAEIQRRNSSIEASAAGAPSAQAATQNSSSSRTRRAEPEASTQAERGDVEVLEPLRVGRQVGVVAPRRGEQHGDGALELAEVADVDRQRAVDPLAAETQRTLRGQRVVLARRRRSGRPRPRRGAGTSATQAPPMSRSSPRERVALQPDAAADPVARLQHAHRAARAPRARGRRRGRTGRRR